MTARSQFGFGAAGSSPPQPDLLVHGHGSIYLLRPTTRRGRHGLDDYISEHHQEWAGAIVVEHRFILDIVYRARHDGLLVR